MIHYVLKDSNALSRYFVLLQNCQISQCFKGDRVETGCSFLMIAIAPCLKIAQCQPSGKPFHNGHINQEKFSLLDFHPVLRRYYATKDQCISPY